MVPLELHHTHHSAFAIICDHNAASQKIRYFHLLKQHSVELIMLCIAKN